MRIDRQESYTTLGRAWPRAYALIAAARESAASVQQLVPAGDLRRFAPTVREIELVGAAFDTRAALGQLSQLPPVTSTLHIGSRRAVLEIDGVAVTIRVVRPESFGAALLQRTGSTRHLDALRRLAAAAGAELTFGGVRRHGRLADSGSEEAVYGAFGLRWIPPELREGYGEVEAAAGGSLPNLVTRADIRGDLHMHTAWSDGRDSLDAMVDGARVLGYEYVAVTDHSISSASARGLDADRLKRQKDAIAAARESYPDIAILHGAEVDILPDGRLDFDDATLEGLDIVLASLHDSAGHSSRQLTDRYVAAMQNPLVHIVTHPTNRMLPGRDGYELDEERLFATAAATGTALEIDGAPGHLDMDGDMARRAVAAGATLTIDGDCHRADLLGRQMLFGVGLARRGWIEPGHVINTKPLPELRRWLARKREGS